MDASLVSRLLGYASTRNSIAQEFPAIDDTDILSQLAIRRTTTATTTTTTTEFRPVQLAGRFAKYEHVWIPHCESNTSLFGNDARHGSHVVCLSSWWWWFQHQRHSSSYYYYYNDDDDDDDNGTNHYGMFVWMSSRPRRSRHQYYQSRGITHVTLLFDGRVELRRNTPTMATTTRSIVIAAVHRVVDHEIYMGYLHRTLDMYDMLHVFQRTGGHHLVHLHCLRFSVVTTSFEFTLSLYRVRCIAVSKEWGSGPTHCTTSSRTTAIGRFESPRTIATERRHPFIIITSDQHYRRQRRGRTTVTKRRTSTPLPTNHHSIVLTSGDDLDTPNGPGRILEEMVEWGDPTRFHLRSKSGRICGGTHDPSLFHPLHLLPLHL